MLLLAQTLAAGGRRFLRVLQTHTGFGSGSAVPLCLWAAGAQEQARCRGCFPPLRDSTCSQRGRFCAGEAVSHLKHKTTAHAGCSCLAGELEICEVRGAAVFPRKGAKNPGERENPFFWRVVLHLGLPVPPGKGPDAAQETKSGHLWRVAGRPLLDSVPCCWYQPRKPKRLRPLLPCARQSRAVSAWLQGSLVPLLPSGIAADAGAGSGLCCSSCRTDETRLSPDLPRVLGSWCLRSLPGWDGLCGAAGCDCSMLSSSLTSCLWFSDCFLAFQLEVGMRQASQREIRDAASLRHGKGLPWQRVGGTGGDASREQVLLPGFCWQRLCPRSSGSADWAGVGFPESRAPCASCFLRVVGC